jgi:predicted NAD/FAD-binding protein
MLRGVRDIITFNKSAITVVKQNPELTLGELIVKMKLGDWFRDFYILPMGGAIWSCSDKAMLDFPATSFVNFFENHGLLSITNRPQWYTLKNKSRDYVETIERHLTEKCTIIKNANIQSITRDNGQVIVTVNNTKQIFADVIFACHPVEIKTMLRDANPSELKFLSKFARLENSVYTHNDTSQMPCHKKCWSSWNYLYNTTNVTNTVSVTYWMNQLQHVPHDTPLFVTLNPIKSIADQYVYDRHTFFHPVFDRSAIEGQQELKTIQGKNGLWFCGAYLRYGFHEDGIWSTIDMVDKMRVSPKWSCDNDGHKMNNHLTQNSNVI